TLLNSTPDDIDLTGWSIADRLKQKFALPAQSLAAGATLQVAVRLPAALGNKGGLITLLDAQGLKVDGVAYTAAEAPEGWTTVF
ncbi:MAG TPA: lamin tail domain-containing protein, partial [Microlunatus sp.]